jgi:nicotinate-nucleotide adenylyltransferase
MQNTTSAPKHIAVFGGTFCPIHNGHIGVALFLQEQFHFDQFLFLPNKAPTLDKTAAASLEHRLAMLELALAPYPMFTIDKREINRPTPSYMIETLESMRCELDDEKAAISLIIGMDSFQQFHRWHAWQKIITRCNLIVIDRPGEIKAHPPEPLRKLMQEKRLQQIFDAKLLFSTKREGFYRVNAGAYAISSEMIRLRIKSGQDIKPFVPASVLQYIKENHLFQ